MVRLKVDVLARLGTPATLTAKRATTTIPIVMESLSDAVAIGLVVNLARPGGNITGVSGFAPLIIQLAARHRLPAVYETRLFPETGGLLSYGPLRSNW